jgi:hypothetical protein
MLKENENIKVFPEAIGFRQGKTLLIESISGKKID